MRFQNAVLSALALIVYLPFASAAEHHSLQEGNPSCLCNETNDLFDALKVNETSPFCSSYVKAAPNVTSTTTHTVTAPFITTLATYTYIGTRTSTTAAASKTRSTSYVFLPGNPPEPRPRPRPRPRRGQADGQADKGANNPPPVPPQPTPASPNPQNPPQDLLARHPQNAAMISSACSCLLSPPTRTVTVTVTVGNPSAATSTKTIYPCATVESGTGGNGGTGGTGGNGGNGRPSMPSPGPAYGLSNYLSHQQQPPPLGLLVNGTSNRLFYLDTRQGSSAVACCHACYFELEYCVQAFYYFYQGCVVMQPRDGSSSSSSSSSGDGDGDGDGDGGDVDVDVDDFSSSEEMIQPGSGSGSGSRSTSGTTTTTTTVTTCPTGSLVGLVYGPDNGGPFRSTGDIAGPCGEGYTNL